MRAVLFVRLCKACRIRAVLKPSSTLCQICNETFWDLETDTLLQRIVRLFYDG